jgi:hypothetical protein
MSFVTAFRTHLWTPHIATMARRLQAAAAGDFVVLADETDAVLDTSPFPKLAHSNDFSAFGLPLFPHRNTLWYNADYPLYLLRRQFPAASHIAMVEYDVAVNIGLAALLGHAHANGIDLIAHRLQDADPGWMWRKTALQHFTRPLQAFFPLLIISARAIDHMLARRLEILARGKLVDHDDWPFCETFIPSAIAELPDARMEEIAAHADLANYRNSFALHVDQPESTRGGTISHPVLGGRAYAEKWLKFQPPEEIFAPDSVLSRKLSFCAPDEFVQTLARRLRLKNPPEVEANLAALARQHDWPAALIMPNLALGKPASQSSVCEWSAGATPAQDARGANNGAITGEHGFHTGFEANPWWQVDLAGTFVIESVVIYNRMEFRERCTRMAVYGAADGKDWVLRGAKLDEHRFGGVDGHPYIFRFDPPFAARFIRLDLIGVGFLHLDEIEVYGQTIPA